MALNTMTHPNSFIALHIFLLNFIHIFVVLTNWSKVDIPKLGFSVNILEPKKRAL